jgi:hypothetical protein
VRARLRWLAILVLVGAGAAGLLMWRRREATSAAIERQKLEIAALETERTHLQRRLDELATRDKNLQGMPKTALRIGIPTSLTRDLVQRVTAGLVDQVTLVLEDLHVRKSGTIRRFVDLGEYDLDVTIDNVVGHLRTGEPDVRFGANQVKVALPVSVASGTGHATIRLKWDGRSVAGAVCGDLEITREVTGSVKPDRYPVAGALLLSSTAEEIVMSPRFPTLTINLKVLPSAESWAAVEKVVADQEGVCGFVLGKVDLLQFVRRIVDKGFSVRLPTERLKAMAVPVGIAPSVNIHGKLLTLGLRLGSLAITENAIWLGADVSILAEPLPAPGSVSP